MTEQYVEVYGIVNEQEKKFQEVLSVESMTWEKEKRFAIQALQANTNLRKAAMTNTMALKNAIINIASIGISLNPALKHAYLVPRSNKICLDISYMGLNHLATSSGAINWCQAKIVYTNDTYKNIGASKQPIHESDTFGDRGKPNGAYCVVGLPDGSILTTELTMTEIQEIRDAKQGNEHHTSPWKIWWDEMAKKSCIKRAYKTWPSVDPRLAHAVKMLNDDEGYVFDNQEKDITPTTDSETLNVLLEEAEPVCDFLSAIDQADSIEALTTIIKDVKTMAEGDRKTAIRKAWTIKKNSL